MELQEILQQLRDMQNPDKIILKKKKFGITANNSLGIYHKDLKLIAKSIGQNDALALELFDSGIYETRLLCSKVFNPDSITAQLMDKWVATFENWEICDSFCMGFFAKSQFALDKAFEWCNSEQEFVKRASFVIMASYGFANKNADNSIFENFLPIIIRESCDERIYVKKAANWALRNIGKRNIDLNKAAITTAEEILEIDSKPAKWIASNALKELKNPTANVLDYPRHLYRT